MPSTHIMNHMFSAFHAHSFIVSTKNPNQYSAKKKLGNMAYLFYELINKCENRISKLE